MQVPGQRDLSYAALIVLKAISDFPEGTYGYSLMQDLTKKYNWNVKSGTVYPILKRLVDKKFIQKKEGDSRQKLYQITPLGHELLMSLETELQIMQSRVTLGGQDVLVLLEKIRTYCANINDNKGKADGQVMNRLELESLKENITQILEILEEKLQNL